MNAKIRDTQLQKIPHMLVVGDREEELPPYSIVGLSGASHSAASRPVPSS